MKPSLPRPRGFTLVELLVVIAIITLLIAITLPVMSRAREKARQTHCMANLHTIAMHIRMYRMDEGAYPPPYDPAAGTGGLNALYPVYLDSRATLLCPDDPVKSNSNYIARYNTLLTASGQMYLWENVNWFAEHYSSYNNLYNWIGYIWFSPPETDETPYARVYKVLTYGQTPPLSWGESLSYQHMVLRWDPAFVANFAALDRWLYLHLAQQVYWANYDPYSTADPTRLADGLGRPLWDPDDPGWNQFGQPSPVFPGLINPNAPDNTIITRCQHHRVFANDSDITLRLDGSARFMQGLSYNWAVQTRP
jgi:prepilin-type N-terminal cleavage/methylation domain-containing protein